MIQSAVKSETLVGPPAVGCPVCDELQARPSSRLSQYARKVGVRNVVLGTTDDLALIPSVGALTREHMLVVSRKHAFSILANGTLQGQAEELLTALCERCGHGSRTVFAFEHGSRSQIPEKQMCTTLHAHLHAIPLDRLVAQEIIARLPYTSGQEQDPWAVASRVRGEFVCSFLWTPAGGYSHCGATERPLPSRSVRRIASEVLGLTEWDWRLMPELPVGWTVPPWAQINVSVHKS